MHWTFSCFHCQWRRLLIFFQLIFLHTLQVSMILSLQLTQNVSQLGYMDDSHTGGSRFKYDIVVCLYNMQEMILPLQFLAMSLVLFNHLAGLSFG